MTGQYLKDYSHCKFHATYVFVLEQSEVSGSSRWDPRRRQRL